MTTHVYIVTDRNADGVTILDVARVKEVIDADDRDIPVKTIVDAHAGRHFIELRDDGWTIMHPLSERVDGSLFDCVVTVWPFEDDGTRGVFEYIPTTGATLGVEWTLGERLGDVGWRP